MENTILIVLNNRNWMIETLHRAASLAQEQHTAITILHLMPTQHAAWLGTEFAIGSLTLDERATLRECQQIAENYGVELVLQPMQYISYVEAIVQAADSCNAQAVFAQPTATIFKSLQLWQLKHGLAASGHTWMSDEQPQAANVLIPQHAK